MSADPIVISSAKRTPMGGLMGDLSSLSANALGSVVISDLVSAQHMEPSKIDAVIMGNVLMAGQGQAPARQAALNAGLLQKTRSITVNKMCGSGMQAIADAMWSLTCDPDLKFVIAGGMESMTNAPHLIPSGRSGIKYGHGEIKDHMALDGLEDAYDRGLSMGVFADRLAEERQISREMQDDFAIRSLKKAQNAIAEGYFDTQISSVEVTQGRKGKVTIGKDQLPLQAKIEKIPTLRPAFSQSGTVTAASSSAISDGAAALTLSKKSTAQDHGLPVIAQIESVAVHAHEPAYFTTAPIPAMNRAVEKAGWSINDVDLFEINEAFAIVPIVAIKELGLNQDKVNINGGACALGHPIGASGARLVVTLIHELRRQNLSKGVAALCIGGGEGIAICVSIP